MRLRLLLLALVVILCPTLASADDHRTDLYGGFSGGGGGSKLFGFHQQLGIALPQWKRLTIVVPDVSVHFGEDDNGNDVTQVAVMFGGRVTATKHEQRLKLSAHALFGTVYSNDAIGNGNNDPAFALGGTVEYVLAKHEHLKGWGVRLHIDQVWRSNDVRNDFVRVSGGIIYRFTD